MTTVLLNKIRTGVVCVNNSATHDSPRVAKAKQRFQQIRERKADNMRRTSALFSEIGRKDVEYFNELHDEIVRETKSALADHREWAENLKNKSRTHARASTSPTEHTYVDVDAVFNDGEETIFDN